MAEFDVTLQAGYRRLEDGTYAGVVVRKVGDRAGEQADVRDGWGYLAVFVTKEQAIDAAHDRIGRIVRMFGESVDNVAIEEVGKFADARRKCGAGALSEVPGRAASYGRGRPGRDEPVTHTTRPEDPHDGVRSCPHGL